MREKSKERTCQDAFFRLIMTYYVPKFSEHIYPKGLASPTRN